MPARRELTMRQIRHMLRLARDGVSAREIGRTLGIARSTVQDNLGRAAAAGLVWPLGEEITDAVLEQRLFSHIGVKQGVRRRVEPDWPSMAREMRRPGVNLVVLWEEYRATQPEGYGYSRFCDLYREFERRLTPVMRQHHAAGDKVFVDYSGKRVPIVDPVTGVVREAEIFVAVLGASSLTYAEATWSQTLPDWIGAHVRLFGFLGGVPRLVVPPPATPSRLRRAEPLAGSARQLEERGQQGVLLRSGDQPLLWHDGPPLRHRRAAGPAEEAARQGQGGERRPLRPELHPRAPARTDVLLPIGVQRRHRRHGGAHQRPPNAPARHHAPGPVRGRGTGGPAAPAVGRVRLRRVAAGTGQPRLPRRGGELPLLGAPRPDPRAGRRASHRPDR